jgi:hypothetical protein
MPLTVPQTEWRIVVTDLAGTAIVSVEGIASNKQVVFRLNRPAQLSFVVPSDDPRVNTLHTDGEPFISCSNRIVKGYRLEAGVWTLRFAGPIMQVEDNGDAETVSTSVTAFDPQQLLYSRLTRRTASSQATAGAIDTATYSAVAGNTIAKEQVDQTITSAGACFIQTTGTFATTTAQSLTFEEGTTVGAALETLTETNTMDVIFDPVDGVSGIYATMSVAAARGSAKPAAVFGYGTANYAVQSIRRLLNGSELSNDARVAGGRPSTGATWPTGRATDAASSTKYRTYESWRAVDPDITNTTFLGTLATAELALRKQPREYLSITPFAEKAPQPFTEYFVGDTIQIWTGSNLRQAVAGAQRVYGMTIAVDDTGFETVSEILAAAN